MPATTRGYRYPLGTDAADAPLDFENLARDVDADVTAVETAAATDADLAAHAADPSHTNERTPTNGSVTRAKLASGLIRTARTAINSSPASSNWYTFTVTWASAFADANYTANVTYQPTGGTWPDRAPIISAKAAGSITVAIYLIGGLTYQGLLNAFAIHD